MQSQNPIPVCVLNRLRRDLDVAPDAIDCVLMRKGKWCNANVYRIKAGERMLTVKEFCSRHPLVRVTIGRFLIAREVTALRRLAGRPGIPTGLEQHGRHALSLDYIAGLTLSDLHRSRERLPRQFFEELEGCAGVMHREGFAHLDMRNLGNIICGVDGRPYFIDFQSCVCTRYLPAVLRKQMECTDYSGIYKGWIRLCSEPLDSMRSQRILRVEQVRRLWIFKGYWLSKLLRKVQDQSRRLHDAKVSRVKLNTDDGLNRM
jgi:predicted Ser/Thr protein kinase